MSTDPKWTIVADPPEPYADKVRLMVRAYDEDAAWDTAFAQLGTATSFRVYETLCNCPEDPTKACDADDHICVCVERFVDRPDPLCRIHGLEDVTSGCFDTNPKRRRQINFHLPELVA